MTTYDELASYIVTADRNRAAYQTLVQAALGEITSRLAKTPLAGPNGKGFELGPGEYASPTGEYKFTIRYRVVVDQDPNNMSRALEARAELQCQLSRAHGFAKLDLMLQVPGSNLVDKGPFEPDKAAGKIAEMLKQALIRKVDIEFLKPAWGPG